MLFLKTARCQNTALGLMLPKLMKADSIEYKSEYSAQTAAHMKQSRQMSVIPHHNQRVRLGQTEAFL